MCGQVSVMDPRQRDICREFFTCRRSGHVTRATDCASHAGSESADTARSSGSETSSWEGDNEEVGYIDKGHLSDSPASEQYWPETTSLERHVTHDVTREHADSHDDLSDGECDVLVTSPKQQLEYQDTQYFHEESLVIPKIARPGRRRDAPHVRSHLEDYVREQGRLRDCTSVSRDTTPANSPRACPRGRRSSGDTHRQRHRRKQESTKVLKSRSVESSGSGLEDHEDSGYAESSVCLSGRLTQDSGTDYHGFGRLGSAYSDQDKLETASVTSNSSVRSGSGRILNRRQFHQGNFVRYRYPTQFHNITTPSANKSAKDPKKSRFQLPPSLQPSTRYSKEPLVQRRVPSDSGQRQWPKPPRYPPKARHAGVECEIIKLVEKLDVGVQCSPKTLNTSCQATTNTRDCHTQYPRVKHADTAAQTAAKECRDQGAQAQPSTCNRMVDTDVAVSYIPSPLLKPHVCTKCGLLEEAKNVNYWVTSNLPQN